MYCLDVILKMKRCLTTTAIKELLPNPHSRRPIIPLFPFSIPLRISPIIFSYSSRRCIPNRQWLWELLWDTTLFAEILALRPLWFPPIHASTSAWLFWPHLRLPSGACGRALPTGRWVPSEFSSTHRWARGRQFRSTNQLGRIRR